MGKMKKVGRRKRRIDKAIDAMHPGKLYTLGKGARSLTRTGDAWKKAKA